MPCQCQTTAPDFNDAVGAQGGCRCATEHGAGCECGSEAPTATERERSLEHIVMELDKRVRRIEASR